MRNWRRECHIVVANNQGQGIDLSNLKCVFRTYQPDIRYPTEAIITIYNLSRDTQNKISGKEFTMIEILAGYEGRSSIIFRGQIMYTSTGKSGANTYINIQAKDSYNANTYAVVNQTLSAGYTPKEQFDSINKHIEKYGLAMGFVKFAEDAIKMPRGRPEFAMHRDVMNNISKQTGSVWYYENQKLNYLPKNDSAGDIEEIRLDPDSGLVGVPQETINGGINIRCLINPTIRRFSLINLVATINSSQRNIRDDSIETELPSQIDSKGQYRVINISYIGDTFGNDWYMNLVCVSVNDPVFSSQNLILKGA